MSTTPDEYALSNANTYAPLSSDVSKDPLLNTIKEALKGGESTTKYFSILDSIQQLYEKVSDKNSWLTGTDEKTGLLVHYLEATVGEKAFFIQIKSQGVQLGDDGNVVLNGTTTKLKDNDYHGIGAVTMTCSWSDFPLSQTSWDLGILTGTTLAWSKISNAIDAAITSAKNAQSEAFLKLKARLELRNGGRALEDGVAEEDAAANDSMAVEFSETAGTNETLLIDEMLETSVTWGEIFFGAAIVLAVALVVLSFVLHNTYHRVRIWNFTRYKLTWTIHFDNNEAMDQGQLVSGPVKFNTDSTIKTYEPIVPIDSSPAPPGVQPPHTANFADMHINCSHQISGIGYVLQFQLQDPKTGTTVYTGTGYFDLPFSGDNSKDVTFEPVSDMQKYYDDNHGRNHNFAAQASSEDGKITMFSTFDYLDGTHPAPGIYTDSTSQYYYQSLLVFGQNDFFDFS